MVRLELGEPPVAMAMRCETETVRKLSLPELIVIILSGHETDRCLAALKQDRGHSTAFAQIETLPSGRVQDRAHAGADQQSPHAREEQQD
jgi:hypothetical protein